MSSFHYEDTIDALPRDLIPLIREQYLENGFYRLLTFLLHAARTVGDNLRHGGYSSQKLDTINAFGDEQLDVDMKADAYIFQCLRKSKVVATASSEENPVEVNCGGTGFSVAFDPLDGSSIVDANFAVGSIFGIWEGAGLINRKGIDQVASCVVQYGPRVTVALALNSSVTTSGEPICVELTMFADEWQTTIPKIVVKPTCKTFAPGNLRATADNPQYKALVDYWIDKKYTLRYSGGLVPDVYHILIKGGGVLSNASSKAAKAKLRLLYECAPIALLVEAAGGASCVCASEAGEALEPISLLQVNVDDLDKRVGVCYGSVEEVNRFKQFLFGNTTA
jgi:sedoheptulose-bisphosphatase